MSAPSPTPSNMPPPATLKRPRQSAAGTSTPTGSAGHVATTSTTATASHPRVKRRKNDVDDSGTADGKSGAGKGKEDESTETSGEVQTKIDFRTLPVEALYKYLEHNDLLPRWDVSPWSEDPCVPPNSLYSAIPPATVPATADEASGRSPSVVPQKLEGERAGDAPAVSVATGSALPGEPSASALASGSTSDPAANTTASDTGAGPMPTNGDKHHDALNPGANGESGSGEATMEVDQEDGGEEETPAPPTTRSKTAPQRKQPTPDRSTSPPKDQQRPVITLSDVHAARDALAERANAHWAKGLGGGQNKEGETIVNFLYKMKVGPGRLLRVYNPPAGAYGTL